MPRPPFKRRHDAWTEEELSLVEAMAARIVAERLSYYRAVKELAPQLPRRTDNAVRTALRKVVQRLEPGYTYPLR